MYDEDYTREDREADKADDALHAWLDDASDEEIEAYRSGIGWEGQDPSDAYEDEDAVIGGKRW